MAGGVIVVPSDLGCVLLPDPRAPRRVRGSPAASRVSKASPERRLGDCALRGRRDEDRRSSAAWWTAAWRGAVGHQRTTWRSCRRAGFRFRPAAVLPELHAPRTAGRPAPAGRGSSLRATQAAAEKIGCVLDKEKGIANYVTYGQRQLGRGFTCRWTSSCRRPTLRSSVILTDNIRPGKPCANG